MGRFFSGQKGQSVVELALVLPILLLLLLCIMEGGRIFAGYVELQSAARDGARYASVYKDKTGTDIKDYVKTRLSLLNPATLDESSGGVSNFQYLKQTTTDKKESWVELTLKYPMEITTPIISVLIGNPFNLQVKMVMRSE